MKLSGSIGVAAAAIALWSSALPAAAACQLRTLAEYHVTMDGDRPVVEASINGHPVHLLVDTGAFGTLLTRPAAADLGLASVRTGAEAYSVGGPDEINETVVKEFKLGPQVAHNMRFMVTTRDIVPARLQGLLGESFLAQADLELDLANGVIRLFRPDGCAGDQVVYWGKAYSVVPLAASPDPNKLDVYVTLNGEKVLATLDTGANRSVVATNAARGAGAPVQQYGGAVVAVFPSFSVGDETIHNAALVVEDLFAKEIETPMNSHLARQISGLPGMVLGADFIAAHRLYIARSQGQVYFSYNGGQIFRPPPQAPSNGAPAKP